MEKWCSGGSNRQSICQVPHCLNVGTPGLGSKDGGTCLAQWPFYWHWIQARNWKWGFLSLSCSHPPSPFASSSLPLKTLSSVSRSSSQTAVLSIFPLSPIYVSHFLYPFLCCWNSGWFSRLVIMTSTAIKWCLSSVLLKGQLGILLVNHTDCWPE